MILRMIFTRLFQLMMTMLYHVSSEKTKMDTIENMPSQLQLKTFKGLTTMSQVMWSLDIHWPINGIILLIDRYMQLPSYTQAQQYILHIWHLCPQGLFIFLRLMQQNTVHTSMWLVNYHMQINMASGAIFTTFLWYQMCFWPTMIKKHSFLTWHMVAMVLITLLC